MEGGVYGRGWRWQWCLSLSETCEPGVIHQKVAGWAFLQNGEKSSLQKLRERLLVVCTTFEVVGEDTGVIDGDEKRHIRSTVVGQPLDGASASGSSAILAVNVKVEASLIDIDKAVHVAGSGDDLSGPLLPLVYASLVVVPLRLGPHQLKPVRGEFVDGLADSAPGEGRLDLKAFVQLVRQVAE